MAGHEGCLMKWWTHFIVFLLITTIHVIQAYPNGAPTSTCISMTPGHGTRQTSRSIYSLSISVTTYSPEIAVGVSILGGDYEGVLLMVRKKDSTDTTPVGKFLEPQQSMSLRIINCGNIQRSAITHLTNALKTESRLIWVPPAEDQGELEFVATIAQNRNKWWMGVRSTAMTYRPNPALTTRPTTLAPSTPTPAPTTTTTTDPSGQTPSTSPGVTPDPTTSDPSRSSSSTTDSSGARPQLRDNTGLVLVAFLCFIALNTKIW